MIEIYKFIEQQNKNSPNATLENGMKIANTIDP
jgi:hypothetical protein